MIGFNTCFPTSFVSKVPLKILMMMKITSINRGAGLCIQPRLMAMSVSTDKKVELTICIRKNEKEKRKFNLCLDSACILPLHRLISQSTYRYNFKIRIVAEFFPQSANMYVDGAGFCFCIQSPDFIH